jgi:hypothetical protein
MPNIVLHPKTHVRFVRIVIPKDARHAFDGKGEKWVSLHTRDDAVANQRGVPVIASISITPIAFQSLSARFSRMTSPSSRRRRATDLFLLREDEVSKSGSLQNALNVFWAGCRPFPYTPEQLASGLSEVVRLRIGIGDHPLDEGLDIDPVARRLIGDAVEIEMGTDGGACSRAYVGASELWGALTPDGRSRLGVAARPANGEALMDALAPALGAVRPLFDPKALIALFADRIVPWQVATQRDIVIFSPMHLTTLGRP